MAYTLKAVKDSARALNAHSLAGTLSDQSVDTAMPYATPSQKRCIMKALSGGSSGHSHVLSAIAKAMGFRSFQGMRASILANTALSSKADTAQSNPLSCSRARSAHELEAFLSYLRQHCDVDCAVMPVDGFASQMKLSQSILNDSLILYQSADSVVKAVRNAARLCGGNANNDAAFALLSAQLSLLAAQDDKHESAFSIEEVIDFVTARRDLIISELCNADPLCDADATIADCLIAPMRYLINLEGQRQKAGSINQIVQWIRNLDVRTASDSDPSMKRCFLLSRKCRNRLLTPKRYAVVERMIETDSRRAQSLTSLAMAHPDVSDFMLYAQSRMGEKDQALYAIHEESLDEITRSTPIAGLSGLNENGDPSITIFVTESIDLITNDFDWDSRVNMDAIRFPLLALINRFGSVRVLFADHGLDIFKDPHALPIRTPYLSDEMSDKDDHSLIYQDAHGYPPDMLTCILRGDEESNTGKVIHQKSEVIRENGGGNPATLLPRESRDIVVDTGGIFIPDIFRFALRQLNAISSATIDDRDRLLKVLMAIVKVRNGAIFPLLAFTLASEVLIKISMAKSGERVIDIGVVKKAIEAMTSVLEQQNQQDYQKNFDEEATPRAIVLKSMKSLPPDRVDDEMSSALSILSILAEVVSYGASRTDCCGDLFTDISSKRRILESCEMAMISGAIRDISAVKAIMDTMDADRDKLAIDKEMVQLSDSDRNYDRRLAYFNKSCRDIFATNSMAGIDPCGDALREDTRIILPGCTSEMERAFVSGDVPGRLSKSTLIAVDEVLNPKRREVYQGSVGQYLAENPSIVTDEIYFMIGIRADHLAIIRNRLHAAKNAVRCLLVVGSSMNQRVIVLTAGPVSSSRN